MNQKDTPEGINIQSQNIPDESVSEVVNDAEEMLMTTSNQEDEETVSIVANASIAEIPQLASIAESPQLPNIRNYLSSNTTDQMKFQLIENRQPELNYKFPAKLYKDKRKSSGFIKRFCCKDWFKMFEFITYSSADDGLYCLACVLFPDSEHRLPKKFISEPYNNWKDALTDMKTHAGCGYHLSSMSRMMAFKQTHTNPARRIDLNISEETSVRVETNRQVLFAILKSLIYCGRQGISLRGHRDDDTEKCSSFNHGNFKELLKFRADAGDNILEQHLASCAKNASYTSKTTQNELLLCIKEFMQEAIVNEVKDQIFGHYYGIQCDEVRDSSNWEQLGLVLRYTKDRKPVERVLEFISCEDISGQVLCTKIIESLTNVGLDTQLCRSQTMDGAGNMAGKYNGCAAKFTEHSPRATYHYCCSHDLNLVLCKSCELKD